MTRNFKGFILSTAAAWPLLGFGQTALAQTQAGAQEQIGGLETIFVTARRRVETLQETPISITAFSNQAIETRNLTDISEIGSLTPNVVIDSAVTLSGSSASTAVNIRGVGQTDFTFNADPAVGTYVDGVYISRSVGGLINLLDIERVEVLRGPQGTLFGKNSTGGAINITTVAPNDEFAGKVGAQIGRFSRREVFGSVNVPLADTLAMRVSASYRNRDGYVESLQGGEDFGSLDSFSGRMRMRWEASDTLTFDLSVDGTRDRQSALPIVLVGEVNPAAPPFAAAFNGGALPMGACFGPGATALPQCFNNQFLAGPFASNAAPESRGNLDLWGANLTATWDISEQLTLKSITAYRTFDSDATQDLDGSPLQVFDGSIIQELNAFSQEFQLLGDMLDGRLNWIVGLYYLDEEGTHLETIRTAIGTLNAGGITVNESAAVFAQASFDITERLTLTAGVRYTDETRNFNPFNSFFQLPNGNLTILPDADNSIGADEFTPLVNLSYAVTESLNVYATYSRGFKSGGFSQRVTSPLPAPPGFGPEFVDLYEIGAKFQNADNTLRVNGAIFQSDYSDVQVLGLVAGVVGSSTINAGKARIRGAELEILYAPIDPLQIEIGVGFLDDEYRSLEPAVVGISIDDALPNTPKWSTNLSGSYRFDVTENIAITPRFDWSYRAAVINIATPSPDLEQGAYHLLNAMISADFEDPDFRLTFGVKNANNATYLVSGQDTAAIGTNYGTFGLPRTWFLRGDFEF